MLNASSWLKYGRQAKASPALRDKWPVFTQKMLRKDGRRDGFVSSRSERR